MSHYWQVATGNHPKEAITWHYTISMSIQFVGMNISYTMVIIQVISSTLKAAHARKEETMSEQYPLIMTEEYWANSQLSIARYYGGINFMGRQYLIVNKDGKDLFELSIEADKAGRVKAIEPGEPADLVLESLIPSYKKLGRDKIIELIKQGKTEKEIKQIAKEKKKK